MKRIIALVLAGLLLATPAGAAQLSITDSTGYSAFQDAETNFTELYNSYNSLSATGIAYAVTAKTSDYTLTSTTNDLAGHKVFTNTGASGAVELTLPAGSANDKAAFYVAVAQNFKLTADGSETFRHKGTQGAAGGYIVSATVGTYWELVWDGSEWIVEGLVGELDYDGSGYFGRATTSVKGPVELATSAETVTGTDTERAVTPSGLQGMMKDEDAMTSNSASHWPSQQSVKAYVTSGTVTMSSKTLTSPVLNTGVSGTAVKDEDDMSSNSASHLVTQQSAKAYVDSGTVTMTNKTLTSPVLNTGVSGTAVKDEDDMSSNSASHLSTQQSIKAYVDSGTVTMTNKTLTSPVLNTGVSGTAFKDEDTMTSNSATCVASQQSVKAYADTMLEGDGTGGRVVRQVRVYIEDGTNANTAKCTMAGIWNGGGGIQTTAVDSVTKGSGGTYYALDANGYTLTIEAAGITGNCIGVLGYMLFANTTATPLNLQAIASSNDIAITFYDAHDGSSEDITAMVDAGGGSGSMYITVTYIASE